MPASWHPISARILATAGAAASSNWLRSCRIARNRQHAARSILIPRELEGILTRRASLLLGALPNHARKPLQRRQRLAGIGPFLQLFDGDVIERLATGAA